MDFPAQLMPGPIDGIANVIALLWLGFAIWRLPYRLLWNSAFTHVLFGAAVAVLVLWSLQAGVPPTLHFHLLGVTALTLMFGWQFASLAVAAVLLGVTLNGQGGWSSFGLNYLIMASIPILLTQQLLVWAQRHLPHNFFIYVYINAFLCAGVAILAAAGVGAALLWLTGIHTAAWLGYQYLPYFPLMFFSEAVLNGMIMTMLVALRPQWVCSFDDESYIDGK